MILNKVYVHLIDIPNSIYIAKNIVAKLFSSDLLKNSEINLYCHYDKNNFNWLPQHKNVKVHFPDEEWTSFELSTLMKLKKDCDESFDEFNVLYLHHKGATQPFNDCVSDWREYMLYFCVDRWKECVEHLSDIDVVGVNYMNEPYPHFSGNYWWAKSNYIKTCPPIIKPIGNKFQKSQFGFEHYTEIPYSYRFDAEFWLGLNHPKVKSLHNSGLNHYTQRYPKQKYS